MKNIFELIFFEILVLKSKRKPIAKFIKYGIFLKKKSELKLPFDLLSLGGINGQTDDEFD